MKWWLSVLMAVVLAGCSSEAVRVGSKDTTESRILAEMFALLIEENGSQVKRMPGLGRTEVVYQALQEDSIDLYPEYSGTALAMMGAPRVTDPEEAWALARDSLADNQLLLLERLGFESNYVVLTRPAIASTHALESVASLTSTSTELRLGVTQSFAERPRDGLESFLDRFGLRFDGIDVFANADQEGLYNALLERQVDLIVGLSTDPEIVDYDLVALPDHTDFFPEYQAAALTSRQAVERSPEIVEALAPLAGKIDNELMQQLNAAVSLDGRPVNRVAHRALYDLGLLATPPRERVPVLDIAVETPTLGTEAGIETLRAVRKSLRGRDVGLQASVTPVQSLLQGNARLALAPAVAAFELQDGQVRRDDRLEAVAAVTSSFLHALTSSGSPVSLVDAERIATGPEGSASHTLGAVIAAVSPHEVALVPLANDSAQIAAEALRADAADVALVFAVPGRTDVAEALATGDFTLDDADAWWHSSARLMLPVMREARISADVYPGIDRVATLSTQLVLFGPAPPKRQVMGQQGPSAYFDENRALTDATVEAINRHLGWHAALDPHLQRAAALMPQVNLREDRINPYPGRAILLLVILAYLVWAGWLFVRPERGVAKK